MQYLEGKRNSTDSYTVCILSIGSLKAHPDSNTLPLAGPDLLIVLLPLGEPCSFKPPQGASLLLFYSPRRASHSFLLLQVVFFVGILIKLKKLPLERFVGMQWR